MQKRSASASSARGLSASKLTDAFGIEVNDDHLDAFILAARASARGEPGKLRRYADVFNGVETAYKDSTYAEMVRSGVPCSQRRNLWLECSGALFRSYAEPQLYDRLCADAIEPTRTRVTREQADMIRIDAYRVGHSSRVDMSDVHASVRRVLLAHEQMFPGSYTQGLNLVVLAFLLLDFEENECFWMLERLSQHYFPFSFHETVVGQHADVITLSYYVRVKCPELMRLLKRAQIDLEALTPRFIGSLGLSAMPYEACFQLWDRMFCIDASEFFVGIVKLMQTVSRGIDDRLAIVDPQDFQSEFVGAFWHEFSSLYDARPTLVRKLADRAIKREAVNYRRMRERQRLLAAGKRDTLATLAIEHPVAYAERVERITSAPNVTRANGGGSFDLPQARSAAKRISSARLGALNARSADAAIASIRSGQATVSIASVQRQSALARRESEPHESSKVHIDVPQPQQPTPPTPVRGRRALQGRSFSLSSPSLARYIAEEGINVDESPPKQPPTSVANGGTVRTPLDMQVTTSSSDSSDNDA